MTEAEIIEQHKKESKKKIEKAEPVFWILSKQFGKRGGYKKLQRANEMIGIFQECFPNEEFQIQSELPVDVLVIAASYIGTNNKNNEPFPFKSWLYNCVKKRMIDVYGEKNNFIESV